MRKILSGIQYKLISKLIFASYVFRMPCSLLSQLQWIEEPEKMLELCASASSSQGGSREVVCVSVSLLEFPII